jgi:hypothetical protein
MLDASASHPGEAFVGEPHRVGLIEVDQDLEHARWLWRVQRLGWAVMLLIVIGAALGVFGHGPLADGQARAAGLTLNYDRFARHGATSSLEAEVEPPALRGDTVSLWLTRSYLDGVELESVIPEPERMATRGDLVVFTFVTAERSGPTRITFTLRPDEYWSEHARAGIEGGESVAFRQFIYP